MMANPFLLYEANYILPNIKERIAINIHRANCLLLHQTEESIPNREPWSDSIMNHDQCKQKKGKV